MLQGLVRKTSKNNPALGKQRGFLNNLHAGKSRRAMQGLAAVLAVADISQAWRVDDVVRIARATKHLVWIASRIQKLLSQANLVVLCAL